jgi:hypothetical protein
MQQTDVAERRKIVQRATVGAVGRQRPVQRQAGGAGAGERLEEFAPVYLFTGESGSTSSATTSRICASVRMPWEPKRGMLVQAL